MRVNSGQHEGQTGMIVSLEEPICVLMTDSTREQLQVFTRDLAESSNVASGVDTCAAPFAVSFPLSLAYPECIELCEGIQDLCCEMIITSRLHCTGLCLFSA